MELLMSMSLRKPNAATDSVSEKVCAHNLQKPDRVSPCEKTLLNKTASAVALKPKPLLKYILAISLHFPSR